jgi:hypothetical protein
MYSKPLRNFTTKTTRKYKYKTKQQKVRTKQSVKTSNYMAKSVHTGTEH